MARNFVTASSQYLQNTASAPVTAAPFTIAAWARSSSATLAQGIIYLGDKDAENTHNFALFFGGSTAGDPIAFRVSSTSSVTANTTTGYTVDTWHHVCAVVASITDRWVFIDGGSKGTAIGSRTPLGVDSIAIGSWADLTPGNFLSGDVAEIAIWNIALTDEEVALLAKAPSPFLIHPEALVHYAPLWGRYSPEIDLIGGLNLTLINTPIVAAHPRIFYIPGKAYLIPNMDTCPAGPYIGASLANVAVGDIAWSNPTNARVSDDSYASSVTVAQTTQQLQATGFGFRIPSDQQIDGILVECEAKVLLGSATVLCRAIKGGSVSATSKSGSWTTTEGFVAYGGASDLWGETWTPADINASNFGVSVRQEAVLTSTLSCDTVRVTVYCSTPGGVYVQYTSQAMTGAGH